MLWKLVLTVTAILIGGAVGDGQYFNEITDEEYALFPRLFHLDDYDSCMLREEALFCLGTFHVTGGTSATLQLMKTYSKDVHTFNRTLLHRGYCVSERCPLPSTSSVQCSPEHLAARSNNSTSRTEIRQQYHPLNNGSKNACTSRKKSHDSTLSNVLRFQRCVSKYARKQNLEVQLSSFQYCHTKQDLKKEWKMETSHLVFLGVVGLVLLLNVLGTVYDGTSTSAQNRFLTSWSIRRNWKSLVGNFPDGDPRLATQLPVDGLRCVLLFFVIFAHAGCIHAQMYLGNPRLMEWLSRQPIMKLFHNGNSVIQLFILLSSFLMAQDMLQATTPPGFRVLPKLLLKRIFRIAPVYLLAVGYAATWWPRARDGPLWPPLVEAESAVCRRNFWPLAFFLGNFAENDEICLLQNWYFQVEMQLYVFALVLMVVLARWRRWALAVLAGLFVATCAASALQAYRAGWAPLLTVAGPENIRVLFSPVEQFHGFYMKPWASACSCLVGLFMAHLHHKLQEEGFDPKMHKRLIVGCQLSVMLVPVWTAGAGHLLRDMRSRGARAAYLALERPVMALIAGLLLFGAYNGRNRAKNLEKSNQTSATKNEGFIKYMFSWRGMYPLGRMSLSVLMLHWIVNKTFAASRHGLYYSSILDMLIDCVVTCVFSYALALPATLLVDIPMQQVYRALACRPPPAPKTT